MWSLDSAWLGGDGAISVPLGAEERIWLFGDTWIRQEDGSLGMVSNSIGLQYGHCSNPMEVHWGEGPSPALSAPDGKGWLWPAGGLLLEETLFLFTHHLERVGPGAWDFRVKATHLLAVLNPRAPPGLWVRRRLELPWNPDEFLVASSPIFAGPHVLVFGTRASGDSRELLLARIPKPYFLQERIREGWEFWAGSGLWSQRVEEAHALFGGVGTELTVARVEAEEGWLALYSPGGISPEIVLRKAASPEGPWEAPRKLHHCPEAASGELYCYGAKLHPECSTEALWITYSVNAEDKLFKGADVAKPRWLMVSRP
ncbi:MAG: DUF4185 domain-containing protein [Thermodesulfobacteriota bacterium]